MLVILDVCYSLANAREYALHYSGRRRQKAQHLVHAPWSVTPADENAVLRLWKASRGEAHALLHENWGFSNRESSKFLWTKNWIHNTNTGARICFQTIVLYGYFTCSYEAPVFYYLITCAIRRWCISRQINFGLLLNLRLLMSYIYMEHLFLMFLDHTQRRGTIGRTPLDEWSARRRDLYLTTHDTHNRQISMPPVGFEPKISAGERQGRSPTDCAASLCVI